tara:strand:+ start:136 stop:453 length:318 start_codon:yes stop_codon:yes gene_type:complete
MARLFALLCALLATSSEAFVVGGRPALTPSSPRASPLRQLRAQEAPPPPPKGRLGATVDQDGKSNVWVRLHLRSALAWPVHHRMPSPDPRSCLTAPRCNNTHAAA